MNKNAKNEIVIFETEDKSISLPVTLEHETVWLTQAQMTELFSVDRTVITKHVNNVFKENEIDEKSNVQILHIPNSDRPVKIYSLDVIISVGYRVKSKRGVEFRKWANTVLKQYILQGYAINNNRINQLNEVIRIMKRTEQTLDSKQVLTVIEKNQSSLARRKMIHLRAVLVTSISLLTARMHILPWKKKLLIYYTL